jgi:hypothetical protein
MLALTLSGHRSDVIASTAAPSLFWWSTCRLSWPPLRWCERPQGYKTAVDENVCTVVRSLHVSDSARFSFL